MQMYAGRPGDWLKKQDLSLKVAFLNWRWRDNAPQFILPGAMHRIRDDQLR